MIIFWKRSASAERVSDIANPSQRLPPPRPSHACILALPYSPMIFSFPAGIINNNNPGIIPTAKNGDL